MEPRDAKNEHMFAKMEPGAATKDQGIAKMEPKVAQKDGKWNQELQNGTEARQKQDHKLPLGMQNGTNVTKNQRPSDGRVDNTLKKHVFIKPYNHFLEDRSVRSITSVYLGTERHIC